MYEVSLNPTIELEQRPDRWAAYVKEFAFFVYGHERNEVIQKVNEGLSALFSSFENVEQLYKFLHSNIDVFIIRAEDNQILYEKHADRKYYYNVMFNLKGKCKGK